MKQPKPKHNMHPAVVDMVITDLEERDRIGREEYGMSLQPFNGRDADQDLYEELLDAAMYLRQKIYERVELNIMLEKQYSVGYEKGVKDGIDIGHVQAFTGT